MCHVAMPIDPFWQERYYVSLNEKNETCHILLPNEPKNAKLNSTITMKSIIHHAKHIGLHTISAFWMVADVYSADYVSQIMNLKAINRYI